MAKKDREQRRQKKLQKHRLKRKGKGRPGKDQRTPGRAGGDPTQGLEWPPGPCWLSDGWHERGANVQAVMTRAHADGRAIAGLFDIDLHKEGTRSARLVGGLSVDRLPSVAVMISEEHDGVAMIEVSPAQAAAALVAGVSLRPSGKEAELSRSMVGELDPADAPLDVLTGKPEAPPPPQEDGWFSRLTERLVGWL